MLNSLICISLTRNLEWIFLFPESKTASSVTWKKACTVCVTSYTRHNDAVSLSETPKTPFYFSFQITAIKYGYMFSRKHLNSNQLTIFGRSTEELPQIHYFLSCLTNIEKMKEYIIDSWLYVPSGHQWQWHGKKLHIFLDSHLLCITLLDKAEEKRNKAFEG